MKFDQQRVYLMECNEWTKIGVSAKPLKRLKMAHTHNPYQLTLSAVLPTDDAEAVEKLLHGFLHGYRSHSGGREWFQIPEAIHADLVQRDHILTDYLTVEWCDQFDAGIHPVIEEGVDVDANPDTVMFDSDAPGLRRISGACVECGSASKPVGEYVVQENVPDSFLEEVSEMCAGCVLKKYPAGVPVEIPVHSTDVRLTRDERRTPVYK